MANKEQLKILKLGVEAWNLWRENNHEMLIDLSGVHLPGIKLTLTQELDDAAAGIYGPRLNLRDANLKGAYIFSANLEHADLKGANLEFGNFDGTNFGSTIFDGANLTNTRMCNAKLYNSSFVRTNMN